MTNIRCIEKSTDLHLMENFREGEIVYAIDTQTLFVCYQGNLVQFTSYNNIDTEKLSKKKNTKRRGK
jgi:hypothetical protein